MFVWERSTIALLLHSRLMESNIPGGTTRMGYRDIFGQEIPRTPTFVSAVSTKIALNLLCPVTAILLYHLQ